MGEKSHVGLSYYICPVTGVEFGGNEILIDSRMKKSLEMKNIIGYKFSPEVQEKIDEGYVALVAIDEKRSDTSKSITPDKAWRTGEIAYLKSNVAEEMFGIKNTNMAYIGEDIIEKLKELSNNIE